MIMKITENEITLTDDTQLVFVESDLCALDQCLECFLFGYLCRSNKHEIHCEDSKRIDKKEGYFIKKI